MKFNCDLCGKEFEAELARFKNKKRKFCSTACCGKANKAKANTECFVCKKPIHVKPSHLNKRKWGAACSKECSLLMRAEKISGENNHQFGLTGDKNSSFKHQVLLRKNHNNWYYKVSMPEHPNADSSKRVLLHRLVVEKNSYLFDSKFFYDSEFGKILYKHYDVHHKDMNTLNNDVSNLQILTRGEHTSMHNANKRNIHNPKVVD